MATVFISHTGHDRELTEGVVARLREARLGLFVDFDPHDGIPAGEDWENVLYRRVRSADALVVVLTSSVPDSRWCRVEINLARSLKRLVLVLRAEPGVDLPGLSDVEWIELADAHWPDRIWDGLVQQGIDPEGPLDWDRRRDPYPGLSPFTPGDAGIFFAREEEIRWLVDRVEREDEPSVLAVVGRSGSGKSSLVYAGLLPRLPESWLVLPSVFPGREPVRALAQRVITDLADRHVIHDLDVVLGELEASPARIADLLDELVDAVSTTSRRAVLVVVDQAEELQTRADAEQQRRFLELVGCMAGARARVCVVMTLRPELLSGTPDRSGLAALRPETLMLEPVAQNRLREVIERPAWRADYDFEDGLVDRLVNDAQGGDALPLLAHTLRELVDGDLGPRRLVTWERYEETGGVLEALDVRAEQIVGGLERRGVSRTEVVLPTMLRFALLSDKGELVSRPVDYTGLDGPARTVIDAFVTARLLAQSGGEIGDPMGVTVRVAHESFLRRWAALKAAISSAGQGLRLHAELSGRTSTWSRNEENESYLLGGDQLRRAETLLAGRIPRGPKESSTTPEQPLRLDFSARERDFIRASRVREDDLARSRRRRRVVLAVVVVLALIGGSVAVIAGVNAYQANADADSRALSVAANDDASSNPAVAAMLAIAAYRESPTAEAEQALFNRYIANQNLGTVFSGAPGNLKQAQVSRDGRVVAGLTENGLLALWSREPSGAIQQRQSTPEAEAEGMGLSPDGTTVWLKRREGLTRYDVATGAMRVVAPLDPTAINGSEVAVSPDGRTVAAIIGSLAQDGVRAWDTSTGQVIADLPEPPGSPVRSYEFGRGRTLVINDGILGGTVQRWTPGDPAPAAALATGAGSVAMVAGADTVMLCLTPPTDPNLDVPLPPNTLVTTRVSDGAIVKTLAFGGITCSGLATDAEGQRAGTLSTSGSGVSYGDDSGSFDLATGRSTTFLSPIRVQPADTGLSQTVLPGLVAGPDGPQIAVVSKFAVTLIPLPRVEASVSGALWNALVGPGQTQLVVADNGATLVNATTLESPGRVIATAPRPAPYWKTAGRDVVVGAHDSLVADRVAPDRVVVRRLPGLGQVAEIRTPPVLATGPDKDDLLSHSLSFDAAGQLVVAVGTDVGVWDALQGREVSHLDLATAGLAAGPGQIVTVGPGRDPSQLTVVVEGIPDVHFVDIVSAREVGRIPAGPYVLAAGIDRTGRYVDLLRRGGQIEVWDTLDGTRKLGPLSTLPPGPTQEQSTLTAGFVDDSGRFAIGAGSRLRVYDVDSPDPTRSLDVGEGQQINGMSADGQLITTQPSSGSGLTLSLKPADWQNEICRVIEDRSFTEAERHALPAAVPDGPICTGT
ncbi:toll/interleukin-1 receptor domain-containing protein [Actinomycetospora sp.]|uniref:toll/interleukin-1 receptor domain-containing protein n=1 Tax=Actinomycetospora sp. TaxID=1872135 RepID=UPI002F3FAEF9